MSPSARWFTAVFLLLSITCACAPAARAWGCEGHQIIAYIAEAHLTPHARAAALKILKAGPVDPSLRRYCRPRPTDPFADASTWADDFRSRHPETGPWHFIDIPRGARRGSLARYCPPATGCVISALEAQVRILQNRRASATARADALRFVIHLVGDIHQPLHDATNNDLGGNCVPVEFFGQPPSETNLQSETFSPNLHAVWDYGIIDHLAPLALMLPGGLNITAPSMRADALDKRYRSQIDVWESQPVNFTAWAWESHALANSVAYGELPHKISAEAPAPVSSCADDHHVAERMLAYHEVLGAQYESAAAPVVQMQLAKAGARLAHVLNAALN